MTNLENIAVKLLSVFQWVKDRAQEQSFPIFHPLGRSQKFITSGLTFSLLALTVLFLISCQPKAIKNLNRSQLPSDIKIDPMLSMRLEDELTFRANLKGFQQEMSGLLVLKKLEKEYRFVMVTDFGLKVFDLSLKVGGENEFHHIMKHMDYEFLKNSIVLNLLMLLPLDTLDSLEVYKNDDFIVYTPQNKMLYFVKDEKVNSVQRFRGKRNVWAEANLSGKTIKIEQNRPEILIQLKPL